MPLLHIQFTVIVPYCVWLRSSARINIRINSCDENPLVKPHAIAKSLLAVASRLKHQSTDSIDGSVVSECRLGNGPELGLETVSFNP